MTISVSELYKGVADIINAIIVGLKQIPHPGLPTVSIYNFYAGIFCLEVLAVFLFQVFEMGNGQSNTKDTGRRRKSNQNDANTV